MTKSRRHSTRHRTTYGRTVLIRFSFRWKNFRGFEDTGWIDVRPITIFVGSNNTGKSTLIAPLLLLKQTLRSRATDVALVTRGDLANVGTFRDFVFRHETERSVLFDIRWHSQPAPRDVEPVGTYAPGEMRLSFQSDASNDVVLGGVGVYDLYRRLYFARKRTESGRGFTLRNLAVSPPTNPSRRMRRSDLAARREQPRHFLFEGNGIFEAQYEPRSAREGPDVDHASERVPTPEISEWANDYWHAATFSSSDLSGLLRETSYLGPLREPLRRVYELSGDPPRDVGTRGEFAPEVLFRDASLLEETRLWLRKFGLGRTLRTRASREEAFSLYFAAGGGRPSVNLADVGFGASQILPMIVQGVSADEGEHLAMEQPEIHLNPRLQSRIADFLAFLAASKKGAIVETHSEHLLLRLRTLMAKRKVQEEDVALYFVDRDRGTSQVRPIPISEEGYIDPSDWPSGFFQDSVREALALASEQDQRARGTS
jgi:predicted ATPase